MQAYGRELTEAGEWCRKYRISKKDSDLHQAWDLYYHVFKRINKQLPQLTTLELQYVAPALVRAQVRNGSTPSHEQRLPGQLHLSWSSCLGWHRHSLERLSAWDVGSHAEFAASCQSCWQAIGAVGILEGSILSTASQQYVATMSGCMLPLELAMPTDGDARQLHRKPVTVAPHTYFLLRLTPCHYCCRAWSWRCRALISSGSRW